MAFQISPGINITEIDQTGVVNQVISNTSAAYVGNYKWGPIDQIQTVSTENELTAKYGKPDDSNYLDFFSAANFIGYGARLQVIRASNAAAKVANTNGGGYTAQLWWNDDLYQKYTNYGISAGAGLTGVLSAKFPGLLGNSLKISYSDRVTRGITFTQLVPGAGSNGITWSGQTAEIGFTGSVDYMANVAVGDFLKFTDSARSYQILQKDDATNQLWLKIVGSTSDAASALSGASAATVLWAYSNYLKTLPTTATTTRVRGYQNDEVAFAIIDADGFISGEPGNVLETFIGSKAQNATNFDGTNYNYSKNLQSSKYVRWVSHPETSQLVTNDATNGLNWGATLGVPGTTNGFLRLKANIYADFGGGTDPVPTITDIFRGYDIFKDTENYESNLLLQGGHSTTVANYIINIANDRKDAIAFVSPPLDRVKDLTTAQAYDSVIDWRSVELIADSSYAVIDSGWKYQYDKYNDAYRWVPLNPDLAGLCARTDSTANPWFSPAGYNRGQVRNVVKLAFNPSKTYRDGLYTYQVNPVISQAGSGTILFGDKTSLQKPSAFDRISIRRLFIAMEKAVATAAKFQLFEFNDEFSRANFIGLVEPFLREVQGSKGISEFKIICDESNNTQEVIDANQFNADIFVKPNATINYIQLNFVASNSQANFSEIGPVVTI